MHADVAHPARRVNEVACGRGGVAGVHAIGGGAYRTQLAVDRCDASERVELMEFGEMEAGALRS